MGELHHREGPLGLAAVWSRRLVRLAGLAVPSEERREWREEWDAELVCRRRELAATGARRPALVLLAEGSGALADAFWYLREEWSLDMFLQDLQHAWRALVRKPLFTGLAVLTLALAIGAVTAIYSVVDGVLLRPLPFPEPDRLVELWEKNPEKGWTRNSASGANFFD